MIKGELAFSRKLHYIDADSGLLFCVSNQLHIMIKTVIRQPSSFVYVTQLTRTGPGATSTNSRFRDVKN